MGVLFAMREAVWEAVGGSRERTHQNSSASANANSSNQGRLAAPLLPDAV
jgi:hypothetical protein